MKGWKFLENPKDINFKKKKFDSLHILIIDIFWKTLTLSHSLLNKTLIFAKRNTLSREIKQNSGFWIFKPL